MKHTHHKGNRWLSAMRFSWDGLKTAWKDELAFKQLILLGVVGIIAVFFLPFKPLMKLIWVIPIGISWITELLNSAIENVVDLCSPEIHPLAKKAKDLGSAAQLVALSLIFTTWAIILWDFFINS